MFKRILKILSWVVMCLFILAVSLVFAIRLPSVQTYLVQKAAAYLSEELNTVVTLDKLQIEFATTLKIEGLYIKDRKGDTLLYAQELSCVFDMFTPLKNKIYLSGIDLKDATFKLQKYPDEKGLNLNFIIDYFSGSKADSTSSGSFDFNPGEIRLSNVDFVYRDNRYHDTVQGINFTDMRLNQIDADIDNVQFAGDTVNFNVDNISFVEKSGFKLEYLEAKASFSATSMNYDELLIKTPYSNINGKILFSFNEFDDLNDFIPKVMMNSKFEESSLSSTDLAYFAKELAGLEKEIIFSGKIRGTVDQLKGTDLKIKYGRNTAFNGDVRIAGLPDFQESFFDLIVDDFTTDKKDIESIPSFPFTEKKKNVLPDNISSLGKIRFNGKFTGFLNDFVAYGTLNTAIGFISSDINLKINNELNKSAYSGHLSAIEFDLGKFTGDTSTLGKTSFKADVQGSGLTLETAKASLDGLINHIDLYGYSYNNIDVDGQIAKKLFNGIVQINEENIGLDFKGEIDLAGSVPSYDFTADIKDAKLAKLHILNRDSTATLNTSVIISLKGKDFDDLTGSVYLYNTSYTEKTDAIVVDTVSFHSSREDDFQKAIFRSDIFDFDITGDYKRSSVFSEFDNLIRAYFPGEEKQNQNLSSSLNISYLFTFKNTEDVFKIFYPQVYLSPGTVMNGKARIMPRGFNLSILSDSVKYNQVLFSGINLNANTSGPLLSFNNRFANININDTLDLLGVQIIGKTDKYKSTVALTSKATDSTRTSVTIKAEANYLSSGQTLLKFLPSDILIDSLRWDFSAVNSILIDSNSVDINNFEASSANQKIQISGKVSDDRNDKVNIKLVNFNTTILNPLLALVNFEMSGIATGHGEITSVLDKPGINSDMYIKDAGIYGDTLGDATINFDYKTENNLIVANALVDRGGIKNIEIEGKYYILNPQDSLDFTINLQKTGLEAFSHYAEGLISEVRGKGSGSIRIHGPIDKITLDGKLRLQQTSFVIDYLNTRYSLSDEVEFSNKYFKFKNFVLNDENGNQAIADGYVYHDHLKNFSLQFDIRAKNFQMLNTSLSQNELYYGKAYATGNVKISGPLDMISMSIGVKTERNTQIFIPLSNPEEVSQSSFINFLNKDEKVTVDVSDQIDLKGIKMDFDLDVTPDAEIQLIFDSKIGDIIKGRGNGSIRMEINTLGDFWMFGNYQVESGDYLFTLQNLINKRFVINPGGTIRWTGSPYDATIDIEGVYKLKASLYDLVQDTTLTERVPVEVHLKLKENLFNPNISFDIVMTDIDPTYSAILNRYISTEEEKSTQTMSLLVLNRFAKAANVAYQGSSSTGVSANAAELLSQQLSVWASQISDVVNVGVNYRAADAFSQEEFEVVISTQILNNRVSIDGNVGVADNNNNTSNIVGDFNAEVKVSKDGRFRFKVFNKTISNNILNNYNSPYTQGAGILYREDFDTLGELYQRFRDHFRKKEDEIGLNN